jgi:hypothetical protein
MAVRHRSWKLVLSGAVSAVALALSAWAQPQARDGEWGQEQQEQAVARYMEEDEALTCEDICDDAKTRCYQICDEGDEPYACLDECDEQVELCLENCE